MIQPILLLIVALALIYIEFFLPGGIMGTTGALLVVAAIFFFAQASENLAAVLLFTVVALAGVGIVIKLALWRIQSHGSDQTIYLDADQEGYHAPKFDESQVGNLGVVHSNMSPSGHIIIDGKRYQALSQTGYLERGVKVEVVGGKGAHLIVKAAKQEKQKEQKEPS